MYMPAKNAQIMEQIKRDLKESLIECFEERYTM